MGSVDRRLYGIASSTLGTMRLVGQMTSMGTTMIVFALTIGKVEIGPTVYGELLGGTQTVFWVSAALCAVGAWVCLKGRPRTVQRN